MRGSRGCWTRCSGPCAISPAELVLTFDNLGEATELERGVLSPDAALGEHPSVTEALPWLLDELDACALSATFFVEAINCELYPEAVRHIAARGHELGLHGWQHEQWGSLSVDRERAILERSVSAFNAIGLGARGFRPPGGELTSASVELLPEHGVQWCSPVGGEFGHREGLTWVPFDWELVDAYHLMEAFSDLRAARGDGLEPVPAGELAERMARAVASVVRSGSPATVILHPFLLLDPEWRRGAGELLAAIGAVAREGELWVGPGGAFDYRAAE